MNNMKNEANYNGIGNHSIIIFNYIYNNISYYSVLYYGVMLQEVMEKSLILVLSIIHHLLAVIFFLRTFWGGGRGRGTILWNA